MCAVIKPLNSRVAGSRSAYSRWRNTMKNQTFSQLPKSARRAMQLEAREAKMGERFEACGFFRHSFNNFSGPKKVWKFLTRVEKKPALISAAKRLTKLGLAVWVGEKFETWKGAIQVDFHATDKEILNFLTE